MKVKLNLGCGRDIRKTNEREREGVLKHFLVHLLCVIKQKKNRSKTLN